MKVFYPIRAIYVDASPPHTSGTQYRVSIGHEHWDDESGPARVYKVQMVYGGKVSGRRSPSYPADSSDWERVFDAMHQLRLGKGDKARGRIESTGPEPGISPKELRYITYPVKTDT